MRFTSLLILFGLTSSLPWTGVDSENLGEFDIAARASIYELDSEYNLLERSDTVDYDLLARASGPPNPCRENPSACEAPELKALKAKLAKQPKVVGECDRARPCKGKDQMCFNGKCQSNQVLKEFAKPIITGVAKAGEVVDKVVSNTLWAAKQALKVAANFIPGVGRIAAKGIEKVMPGELKTGNEKVDQAAKIVGKVLRRDGVSH